MAAVVGAVFGLCLIQELSDAYGTISDVSRVAQCELGSSNVVVYVNRVTLVADQLFGDFFTFQRVQPVGICTKAKPVLRESFGIPASIHEHVG